MSTQRSGWAQWMLVAVAIAAAAEALVTGQIVIPNTFTNHTVADAPQVNANFTALGSGALNRTGGTMTGTLTARDILPATDNTYALGSASFKWKLPFIAGGTSGQFLQTDGAGTTSWATATPTATGPCGLRLTLETGVPFSTTDQTAKTSVFVTPVLGGQCAFYDGSATWTTLTASEITVAVPATTSTMYDVFCFNSSGTVACDAAVAWTNDTTRATALATQNSVYVKSGTTTRRYIGSFRTTTVSGQTEDSVTKRYVWSYYNRVDRSTIKTESANTWAGTNAGTYRALNNSTANAVDLVIGVVEEPIYLAVNVAMSSTSIGLAVGVAAGLDSAGTVIGTLIGGSRASIATGIELQMATGFYLPPTAGRHTYVCLEIESAGTTTLYGTGSASFFPGIYNPGISARHRG